MKINDFDKIVKEQMEKMEITPSAASSRKLLGFKLFFANLIVFHKLKLYTGLFLLIGGISIGALYLGLDNETTIENKTIVVNEDIANEDVANKDDANNNLLNSKKETDNIQTYPANEKELANKDVDNQSGLNDKVTNSVKKEGKEEYISEPLSNYIEPVSEKQITKKDKLLKEKYEKNKSIKDITINKTSNSLSGSNYQGEIMKNNEKSDKIFTEKNINGVLHEKTLSNKFDEKMDKASIIQGGIITEVPMVTSPSLVPVPSYEDYANNPKKRGLTIDAYFSPINRVDIDNQLDADLQEFNWDFYKEFGYVNTGVNGGANVNYNWNNFKIGTGFQINKLKDYKSNYGYYYMPPIFGNQNISGAIVYEQDTSLIFFVDPLNKELHKEINSPFNTYSYLNIPLTLGYEFDLKYVSLELNAGVQYGYLIKAKGVEVRTGGIINDPLSSYYYEDKYMDLMTRKSDYLNKHQFALLANATLRVRLSPSFDFYTSINYTTAKKGIYKDNYFLQKTFNNYGTKFGITYYMNKRLKIKESTSLRF